MHADYLEKTGSKISYNSFHKTFKSMNISMALLGHEECEICSTMAMHKKDCHCEDVCDISEFLGHKTRYRAARKEYQQDSQVNTEEKRLIVSADLQKVIMLPRMEQFKTAVFTRRLTVFNETFAEVGKGKRNHAVVWHEATSGRRDEDIASAFYEYLLGARSSPRGIEPKKKENIVNNLLPLMPPNRRFFWNDLPLNAHAKDLTVFDE
ncbi:CAI-1 autoinducer sensor kinase/phosphatase CqsS [Elysia marginata]|uniref:CAI-1 autoinducer sensor kinase/phosphatase CqsS n=1 Tax=Elysia marginata TaxID=1093978 RepID=A0AAV4HA14_9GAST|nr:CAI-1 autoinducer sensor kinase/phosphatase CqsS [Elysia marginata]